MLADWLLESDESLDQLMEKLKPIQITSMGSAAVQVIRTGPGQGGDALLQCILGCVNLARHTLTLTTPYLIPDESLLQALRGAAARGVQVHLIIPEKIDSFSTRYACRSYFDDLLSAGVHIHRYRAGLLHTKSIRVDDDLAMFGTANLDLRSLWLNYEVALLVYDRDFNARLARLHASYLAESVTIDQATWNQRGFFPRLLENLLRLFSPLL